MKKQKSAQAPKQERTEKLSKMKKDVLKALKGGRPDDAPTVINSRRTKV